MKRLGFDGMRHCRCVGILARPAMLCLLALACPMGTYAQTIVDSILNKVSDKPFYFSVPVEDGNYKVTVTLGQAAALPCVVTLRDEQGRELLRQRMEEGTSLTLSTQGLAAGLYFVTLETPQGTSTQKLVVER